jgi:hypothetical protein
MEPAETTETSCSPEHPPNNNPTLRFVTVFLRPRFQIDYHFYQESRRSIPTGDRLAENGITETW